MKKLLMGLGIAALIVCSTQLVQAQTTNATTTAQADKMPGLPKFESDEANKGMLEFEKLIKEVGPYIKANDMEKVTAAQPKMASWQQESSGWLTALSAEDQAKLNQYLMEITRYYQPAGAPTPPPAPAAPGSPEAPAQPSAPSAPRVN
jgi:hypothetical protein